MVTSGARLKLFIDESYGTDDYYVAGVLVTESQYNRLVTGLDEVRLHAGVKFGLEPEVEFHAHRLMQAQGEWACMKGQLHEAVAVYRHALRAIVASGSVVLFEGVDVRRLNGRYRYPDSPYEVTLRHLLERADRWCAGWDATCEVTADMIDRQDDFAEAIAGYTRVGTPGFRPSRLERILGVPNGLILEPNSVFKQRTWWPTSCAATGRCRVHPRPNGPRDPWSTCSSPRSGMSASGSPEQSSRAPQGPRRTTLRRSGSSYF